MPVIWRRLNRKLFFKMYAPSHLPGPCGTTWPGLAWQGFSCKSLLNPNEKLQSNRDIRDIIYMSSSSSPRAFATSKEILNQYSAAMHTCSQGYLLFSHYLLIINTVPGPLPALRSSFMSRGEWFRIPGKVFEWDSAQRSINRCWGC